MLSNKKNGTLYVGVTNDISRRTFEHKIKFNNGFSNKYELNKLVYCEAYNSIQEAIAREKQLKHWKREWKIKLINDSNPEWDDICLI